MLFRSRAVSKGCIWQFFTYMFLHSNIVHLLFNLLMLYFFGSDVESALGSKRLLCMYFLGGITGGLLWYVFNIHSPVPMVGASGAIYSVVIAFGTLYPNRPITLLLFFVLPVTLLAKYLAIGTVVLSLLYLMSEKGGDVAHLAHLGGMAVGYLYVKWAGFTPTSSWFQWPKYPSPRNPSHLRILPSPLKKEEFMEQRIDPILDKIAEHGIQSLTREERRLLDEAKDRLP